MSMGNLGGIEYLLTTELLRQKRGLVADKQHVLEQSLALQNHNNTGYTIHKLFFF